MSNVNSFVKRVRDIMYNDSGLNGDAQRIEQLSWMLFLKVYDSKEEEWELYDDYYSSAIPEKFRWKNWAHDDKTGNALTGDELLAFINNELFPTLKNLNVTAETETRKLIVRSTFEDANNYMKDGVLLRKILNIIDELDLNDSEESHTFGDIYESILKDIQSESGEFYTPRAVTAFMAKMIKPKIGEKMADFACGTGGFITSWLDELHNEIKDTKDRSIYDESIYGIEKKQFPYMLCVTNMLLHNIDHPRIYHDNSLFHDLLDYGDDDKFNVILMNPPYGGREKKDVKDNFPADLASSETADLFLAVIMYRLKHNGRAAVILPDGFLFGMDNAKVSLKKKLIRDFNLHTIIRMPASVFMPYTPITTNILFFENNGPTKETWYYRMDMPKGYKHFSKTKPIKFEHFDNVIKWWDNRKVITIDGHDKAKNYSAEQLENEFNCNLDLCGFPHEEEEILPPDELIKNYKEKRAELDRQIDDKLKEICKLLEIDL